MAMREILVDESYQLVQAVGLLQEQSFSEGAYDGLFTDSTDKGFKMGDEYTFGAPRVGNNDWALMNCNLASAVEGQIWCAANFDGLVPPTDLFKIVWPFYHTENGTTIFNDRAPEDIDSKICGAPAPSRNFESWTDLD
ncbi:lipase class 3 [Fusarium longipes]|uniref:Lipase class 3 n=1 Tax=Fusarium longipes TaxID=694270 RepID=A0A395SD84_9HYPO|nr:lipase class 3 [Fusarium longipes]